MSRTRRRKRLGDDLRQKEREQPGVAGTLKRLAAGDHRIPHGMGLRGGDL